ncbi:MAG: carbon-nitrogen hydrolase family protein [Parasporobacterium sp.]|nr:carbon-nitrogen hydrolase family protein [Parasporobacterium sp.]
MKIALAQMKMFPDIRENYEKSLRFIREAAGKGADLVCFPEVQLTTFFPQYPDRDAAGYVITEGSEYVRGVREACAAFHIFASPNFYMEEGGRRYDMSLLIDDHGEIIGRQKMVHIAQCEQFYEQCYYTPSEEGFRVFDTSLGRIGIVVCFDRHYPESIRTEALRGADLILIPTANTTTEPLELFRWEVQVQAFQNSVNIAMCNRTGREDAMEFAGESLVSDYTGKLTALAGQAEEMLIADIDMTGVAAARKTKPYTSLRRPELYE